MDTNIRNVVPGLGPYIRPIPPDPCSNEPDTTTDLPQLLAHLKEKGVTVVFQPEPATVDEDLMKNPSVPFVLSHAAHVSEAQLARRQEAYEDQVRQALNIIRNAKKPVKWRFIAQQFRYAEFRGMEKVVRKMPGVKTMRFKQKTYYSM